MLLIYNTYIPKIINDEYQVIHKTIKFILVKVNVWATKLGPQSEIQANFNVKDIFEFCKNSEKNLLFANAHTF